MSKSELIFYLEELNLTQADLARLLSVNPRTVSRWVRAEEKIPRTVQQVFNAWLRLKRRSLPWRPDQIPFNEDWQGFADQIKRLREHAIITDQLLSKVEARGGPATFWKVKLNSSGGEAIFGPLILSFSRNTNDSFSPSIYSRSDQDPNLERDQSLLEDAMYCIAKTIAKNGWPK